MALSPTTSRSASSSSGGAGTDGWVDASSTPLTYASATTFTTATDTTAIFTPGTRVKLTNSGVKYFVVVSSAFAATTTVTVTGGTDYTLANAAISAPFYSYMANPQGWPTWFNYTPTIAGGTTPFSTSRFSVVGRMVTVIFYVQVGTSNATSFSATLPIAAGANSVTWDVILRSRDNGVNLTTPGMGEVAAGAQTTMTLYPNTAFGAWTASGLKVSTGQFSYEI